MKCLKQLVVGKNADQPRTCPGGIAVQGEDVKILLLEVVIRMVINNQQKPFAVITISPTSSDGMTATDTCEDLE